MTFTRGLFVSAIVCFSGPVVWALETCQIEGLASFQKEILKELSSKKHTFPKNCESKAAQEKYLLGYRSGEAMRAPFNTPDEYLGCWTLHWSPARKVKRLPNPSFCEAKGYQQFKEDFLSSLKSKWGEYNGLSVNRACSELKNYGKQIAIDLSLPNGTPKKGQICIRARQYFNKALSELGQLSNRYENSVNDVGGASEDQLPMMIAVSGAGAALTACTMDGYEEYLKNPEQPPKNPVAADLTVKPITPDEKCTDPEKTSNVLPANR